MHQYDCLISICIPAYKRPENLDRLLQSISVQKFKNFEIIITDDSLDDSLKKTIQKYNYLPITYYENAEPLGTPANWNFAIEKAKGEWIKLLHDDDWLSSEDALLQFAEATRKGNKFIFSGYANVILSENTIRIVNFPTSKQHILIKEPMILLPKNIIGPPSVTMLHRSVALRYDERLKWRVDIDFYIQVIKQQKSFTYIDKPLIHVGISDTQVTVDCLDQPEVELPEALVLLKKYGTKPLRNFWVYDAFWRIVRNVGVRSLEDLNRYTPNDAWPVALEEMVFHQKKIPTKYLKVGVISKTAMTLSYLTNRRNLI